MKIRLINKRYCIIKIHMLRYISIYICTEWIQLKNVFCYVKLIDQLLFKTRFENSRLTYWRKVINPLYQTLQGQSVAKPGTPMWNILIENTNLNPMVTCSTQYAERSSSGGNTPGDEKLQRQNYPVSESLNPWFKRNGHRHKHTSNSGNY